MIDFSGVQTKPTQKVYYYVVLHVDKFGNDAKTTGEQHRVFVGIHVPESGFFHYSLQPAELVTWMYQGIVDCFIAYEDLNTPYPASNVGTQQPPQFLHMLSLCKTIVYYNIAKPDNPFFIAKGGN